VPAVPGTGPARVAAGATSTPPTTGRGTFVTLQPADPSGHIPGDADDGADFWGLGVALIAIVVVIVAVRLIAGRRPDRQSRGER
jgi:hypothetical protein